MISVCIATYNGEEYLKEQLDSILSQLSKNDEIVISDDHSTDNTIQIIRSYSDDRIRVILNERGKGYVSNFENALLNAKGDFVFLSDQDDIWLNNKVKYCMEQLVYYDFIVSDAILIDKFNNTIDKSYFKKRRVYNTLAGNIFKFGYLGCCMAFRKEILNKALPFPQNHQYCLHDNWLFLIAKAYYRTKISNEKLIKYRRHDNNTSNGGFSNSTSFIFKITYRCYLLFYLLKRFMR